jgi:hypothetical protein
VTLCVKLIAQNNTIYSNFSQDTTLDGAQSPVVYDLENYQIPALVRKVIKKMKKEEIVQIDARQSSKVDDHLPDPHHIFRRDWLSSTDIRMEL